MPRNSNHHHRREGDYMGGGEIFITKLIQSSFYITINRFILILANIYISDLVITATF